MLGGLSVWGSSEPALPPGHSEQVLGRAFPLRATGRPQHEVMLQGRECSEAGIGRRQCPSDPSAGRAPWPLLEDGGLHTWEGGGRPGIRKPQETQALVPSPGRGEALALLYRPLAFVTTREAWQLWRSVSTPLHSPLVWPLQGGDTPPRTLGPPTGTGLGRGAAPW